MKNILFSFVFIFSFFNDYLLLDFIRFLYSLPSKVRKDFVSFLFTTQIKYQKRRLYFFFIESSRFLLFLIISKVNILGYISNLKKFLRHGYIEFLFIIIIIVILIVQKFIFEKDFSDLFKFFAIFFLDNNSMNNAENLIKNTY